ncbi:MAG: hypothetical protein JSR48_02350 [Verrucomicrobia bacterium]|nr:hypothetical protein [Verrucomicrobiota bacterium]
MPWSYRYDPPSDCLISTATGVLTAGELTAGLRELRADPHFQGLVRLFGDYSTVDRFDLAEDEVRRCVTPEFFAPVGGRCAVLLFQPLGSARFRDYLETAAAASCRIFAERRLALEWINEGVARDRHLTAEATMAALPRPAFGRLADLDRARSIRAIRPPGSDASGAPFH